MMLFLRSLSGKGCRLSIAELNVTFGAKTGEWKTRHWTRASSAGYVRHDAAHRVEIARLVSLSRKSPRDPPSHSLTSNLTSQLLLSKSDMLTNTEAINTYTSASHGPFVVNDCTSTCSITRCAVSGWHSLHCLATTCSLHPCMTVVRFTARAFDPSD